MERWTDGRMHATMWPNKNDTWSANNSDMTSSSMSSRSFAARSTCSCTAARRLAALSPAPPSPGCELGALPLPLADARPSTRHTDDGGA
eukprot:136694-Chlamydomonas_euryale.AAC.6